VSEYEPVLSSKALATLLGVSKRKQRDLSDILFKLSAFPSQQGDYAFPDGSGRLVQYILIGNYVIGYWPDHAVKELRIVEIDLV